MEKAEYLINGLQFQNFEEFIAHFNHVFFNGRPVWNGNLNAFNDILRGGFGQPEEGYTIKWIHSEEAQKNLHADSKGLYEELIKIIKIHGEGGEEEEDKVKLILE
jgi:hypothetical protein